MHNDDPWPWRAHFEVRRREVSAEAYEMLRQIMEGDPYKMPEKLVLESERAMDLIDGAPDEEYEYVDSEYAGQWRWGVTYQAVIKDKATSKLWGVTYQIQTGDNYYNSLEDGNVHFYPVEAVEVTTTEYKRIK